MKTHCLLTVCCSVLMLSPCLRAQEPLAREPSPPMQVEAVDVPNDSGDAIEIRWKDSSDPRVHSYEVFRSRSPQRDVPASTDLTSAASAEGEQEGFDSRWQSLGTVGPGEETKRFSSAEPGVLYSFKVVARTADSSADSAIVTGESRAQWFDREKSWILVIGALICFSVIFFIQMATRGRQLFVRKIAGLEAVDEAVGRATEMGRPVVFVPGIMDMDNVQTLAGPHLARIRLTHHRRV